MKQLARGACLGLCIALVGVVVVGMCLKAHAAPATNVATGFQRPLIIDLKHERDIDALKDTVAKLEARVTKLEKDVVALKPKK